MAKNTGRTSHLGRKEEAKGQFLKAKNAGGSFGKHKTPWQCRWKMHNWSDWTTGANYKVCFRCKVISHSR